jgi:hypothetical protein
MREVTDTSLDACHGSQGITEVERVAEKRRTLQNGLEQGLKGDIPKVF